MNVEQIMSRDVAVCGPDDNLESVAMLMWNNNCGAIPVVDHDGKPCGMVTDRDVAMASALRHKPLWEIRTQEVSNHAVYTCTPNDDVKEAMDTMRDQKIRRLAVIDEDGRVRGLLSIDDVIQYAGAGDGLRYEELIPAIKEVCQPQPH
jgi:CBS domain-containing protein